MDITGTYSTYAGYACHSLGYLFLDLVSPALLYGDPLLRNRNERIGAVIQLNLNVVYPLIERDVAHPRDDCKPRIACHNPSWR